jgi:hypothetical protein
MSILETMVKVAYTVGRFQPPTIGHRMMIEETIKEAGSKGKAYVFVSSTKGTTKAEQAKNPLSSAEKLPLLRKMFPSGVEFVDTATCAPRCGGPGAAFGWLLKLKEGYKPEDISIVLGKERLGDDTNAKEYFGTEAPLWGAKENPRPAKFVPVGHNLVRLMDEPANNAEHMSGTKARSYVTESNDKKKDFYLAVGADPNTKDPDVEAVYSRIYKAKFGPKESTKGGEEEKEEELAPATTGPDGEPPVGGRTRRVRNSEKRRMIRRRRGSTRKLSSVGRTTRRATRGQWRRA